MKVIAKTKGAFELFDIFTRNTLGADRPYVITWSQFFEARTGAGQIEVLANNLPDSATDEEFLEYWKENPEIAVEAFITAFAQPEPAPEPAKRGAKKEA